MSWSTICDLMSPIGMSVPGSVTDLAVSTVHTWSVWSGSPAEHAASPWYPRSAPSPPQSPSLSRQAWGAYSTIEFIWLEHGAGNTKVVGFIPTSSTYWTMHINYVLIGRSLWTIFGAKCYFRIIIISQIRVGSIATTDTVITGVTHKGQTVTGGLTENFS